MEDMICHSLIHYNEIFIQEFIKTHYLVKYNFSWYVKEKRIWENIPFYQLPKKNERRWFKAEEDEVTRVSQWICIPIYSTDNNWQQK